MCKEHGGPRLRTFSSSALKDRLLHRIRLCHTGSPNRPERADGVRYRSTRLRRPGEFRWKTPGTTESRRTRCFRSRAIRTQSHDSILNLSEIATIDTLERIL